MKVLKYMAAGLLAFGLSACSSDYLDTMDHEYLDEDAAREAAGHTPDAFLNGMWSHLVDMYSDSHDTNNFMSVLHACDLAGEDIAYLNGSTWFIYDYQLDDRMNNYRRVYTNWNCFYTAIDKANAVIGLYPGLEAENNEGKALLGQALAYRGMALDYLIQLFRPYVKADGTIDYDCKGVPVPLTTADGYTTEEVEELTGVNTVRFVLDQAQKDLEKAAELLEAADFQRANKDYIDANVANGLLARHYLFTQQWDKAATTANKARQGYQPMDNAGLHDGMISIENNDEIMWGFIQSTETSTIYASFFSHISNIAPGYAGVGYKTICIDARLYSMIPDDDYRKSLYNGPDGDDTQPTASAQYPYANLKFGDDGNWTMDYTYMRAAEMYLIEAEALARQDKNAEAAAVLGQLMAKRQPSWNMPTVTVNDVLLQRRIELWGEGFVFFDLKRCNKGMDRNYAGNNHQDGYKLTVPAQDVRWTYQIPLREIQENDRITEDDQNPATNPGEDEEDEEEE